MLYKTIKDGSISAKQTPAAGDRPRRRGHRAPPRRAADRERPAPLRRQSVKGRTDDWEVEHCFPERQRVLRHLLLAGPDAQVC